MFSAANCAPGLRIEVLEDLDRFLDHGDVEAGLLLDDRQAVEATSSRWCWISTRTISACGVSGVTWSSRHSSASRAPTPGGSKCCRISTASSICSWLAPVRIVRRRCRQVGQFQEAVVVDVRDQKLDQVGLFRREVEEAELLVEVVLQRLRPRRHVRHGVVLAVAFFVDAVAARAVLFVEAFAVIAATELRGG